MNVVIKLFGTLGKHLPEYDHNQGMDVQIPDGARVEDLFAHLGIQGSKGFVIAAKGKLLKLDDKLENGDSLQIFQSVFGG